MKHLIRSFFILMLLALGSQFAWSQEGKVITGIVRDSLGNPIPGVSVTVRGSKVGTSTDANGNFRLSGVPANASVVTISGIGYTAQDVAVSGSNTVNATISTSSKNLSEVVVTGFGQRTQTRKLAYSVQPVQGEDLARAGNINIANSLQGKVAGVMVNQGAGGPSSSSRIRIRGNTSISSNNTMPLVVVDGILIQPGVSGADSWGDARDFGNQLKNLNPEDYESINVLKGSAASALYGSQAQNGVILITTKKGKSRPGLGVTVTQNNMWEDAYKLPDFQNEYGGGTTPKWTTKDAQGNDQLVNNGTDPYYSFGPVFDGRTFRDADGALRPWQANDLMSLFRTGKISTTNVAVEGGSERTTVRFSYSNSQNSSIQPNNSFDRNNFALRATQKVGQFIMLDASLNYATSLSRNPILQGGNSNPIFRLAYSNARHYPLDYALANYIDPVNGGRVVSTTNPYLRGSMTSVFWNLYQVDYRHREDNLLANLDITANITPWLNLLVRSNINAINIEDENKVRGDGPKFNSATYGSYSIGNSSVKTGRLQAVLSGNKKINDDFDLNLSFGGETQRGLGGKSTNVSTSGGFKVPELYALSNSKNALSASGGVTPQSRLDAIYAYGDVTWNDVLTLSFSARNDWNSTLTYPDGSGDFSYFYPSVGLSWIFSEWMADKGYADFLSFGKLRASLGYTGAGTEIFATTSGNYALLGNYTDTSGALIPRYGYASMSLGNLGLKPERTREWEFGADLRFLQDRLRFDISVYKKNTFNQIIDLNTPSESGISARKINAGNVQNRGVEIILAGTPVRNESVEWNTTFNFSRNRNKIIDLYPGVKSKDLDLAFGADVKSVAMVGEDFGTIVSTYAYATDPASGQKLLKQNGQYWRSGDIGQGSKNLGTMMENFLLSNINDVSYKGFTLFVQFDAKIGGKMASATHQYGSQYGSFESTLFGRDAAHGGITYVDAGGVTRNDGIIPEGVFAPGTKFGGNDASGMTYQEAVSKGYTKPMAAWEYYDGIASWGTGIREYSVFENSWVALREVSIGYQVPKSITSKIRFQNLRVSLIGRNLVYLYNTTKDDIFPESIFSSRAGAFAEYGGLPYVRSYGFMINAGF